MTESGGGGRRRRPLLTSSPPVLFRRLLLVMALLILPPPPPALAAETKVPDGYSCWANRGAYPCRAYAFYRAAAPYLLDLAAIGDLFSVSRAMITNASGIPYDSVAAALSLGQPLLVPLTCSCAEVAAAGGNRSYALLPYQIRAGDTFYRVSTFALQNLTTWRAVELANPALVPTKLKVGVVAVFPVFCQCPPPHHTTARGSAAESFFVTYASQLSDTRSSIASLFGADPRSLIAPNSSGGGSAGGFGPFTAVLVPVSRLPVLQLQRQQSPPPPPSSCHSGRDDKGAVVVGLAVGIGVVGLLLFVAVLCGRGWKKMKRGGGGGGVGMWKEKGGGGDAQGGPKQMMLSGWCGDLMAEIVECLDRYRVFDMAELRRATSGFDDGCRVGGSVYRGCLDGVTYAVKKLKWNACQELKILQKVQDSPMSGIHLCLLGREHALLVQDNHLLKSLRGICALFYINSHPISQDPQKRICFMKMELQWALLRLAMEVFSLGI